ncbi:centriole, cilia and spindle-associated protein [Onychomys torridus]|uniref:centriole, cilia and spindle-associated protein n=1 Tax=Onychomys torridus TaxID=38674 RepID=UPI00167F52A6|nr:centriole, cilia and spindle-associated protein [Onychomys torridus]XP_036044611.1 centriole, cilia and spindle-associated protein [Onychomys torridus]
MSPGSGVKSEYMKRYREPRWDEYAPCYRELLRYRLGRRLLEQAHAPWLWDAWGPDSPSDSSASPSPAPRGALGEPSAPSAREEEQTVGERGAELRGAEVGDAEEHDTVLPAPPKKDREEKPEQQTRAKETDRVPVGPEPRQQPSALFARASKKATRSPQRSTSKIKENKHPFALYGWGEKQMDTGSQKTHNVCASASVHEIHESALRAKNRRQVEKRRLAAQRQRAHSVDVEKDRRVKPTSAENPWLTEYMRCYSARA